MPRKYNEKLHPRKHNGQWAKKGTGVLLPPKSGKSRSYASRNSSRVGAGARPLAGNVNKVNGSKTRAGKSSSNLGRNIAITGAVVAVGGLAAYGAAQYGSSLVKGGPKIPVAAKFPALGNGKLPGISGIRPRLQGTGGKFIKTKSAFPRAR